MRDLSSQAQHSQGRVNQWMVFQSAETLGGISAELCVRPQQRGCN